MLMQSRAVAGVDRVPWCSLANALRLILHRNGCDADIDDLHAALADPWSFCAATTDPDAARWPLYARDRHLVAAGRLFGLTIRPIHPPEAAKGLSDAKEFRQHFAASYCPLILRALEHEQPVLAWRGWPGRWDAVWGIIRKPCSGEVGFSGSITAEGCPTLRGDGPNKSGEGDTLELVSPPTQVYVVERVQSRKPDPEVLLHAAFDHARDVLTDGPVEAFGVVAGRSAWDRWLETLARIESEPAGATSTRAAFATAHALLARSVVESHQCAERFLARQSVSASTVAGVISFSTPRMGRTGRLGEGSTPPHSNVGEDFGARFPAVVDAWRRACQVVVTYLSASMDEAAVRDAIETPHGRRVLRDQIETARDAAGAMLQILKPDDGAECGVPVST